MTIRGAPERAYALRVPGRLGVPTPIPRDLELAARLESAPASAEIRGILFRLVTHALRQGLEGHGDAHAALHDDEHRGYAMYPLRDYLLRLHRAATAIGPGLTTGLARLHARGASFLLAAPAARIFLGPRDRTLFALLQRLERSRSLLANYGHWRVSGRPGDVSIVVRDEYVWLDAVWCPLIRSAFPACDVPAGEVELDPDGPWSGRIRVRW